MSKTAKKPAGKASTKKVAKKSVAKPAKRATSSKTSKTSSKDLKAPHSASFKKEIRMFKEQPDYFTLNNKYAHEGKGTKLVHVGNEPGQEFGGVSTTLDFSTTFAQPHPGDPVVFDYARCGNPTRLAFERQLASMEGSNYAFAMSSGMAAHVTITNMLQQGDHILCIDDVYGGTQRYMRRILGPNTKIEVDFECFSDIKHFKKAVRPDTKVVWLETPTNPTLKVFDIQKIATALKEVNKDCILVVDNTFMTPINQNPIALGADIVVHSVTKYIGGHSDIIAGAMCFNSRELYDKLFFILKTMGTGLCAFDSWLALRSAKTLEVRVERACRNALAVAKTLEASKKVEKTVFPGLPSHPSHSIVKKQCKTGGAMISFYIKGGAKAANAFLRNLKVFTLAESLGGVESLAENPYFMTHGSVPAAHRAKLGIEANFIRLSVGIETEKDLVEDIKQALAKA